MLLFRRALHPAPTPKKTKQFRGWLKEKPYNDAAAEPTPYVAGYLTRGITDPGGRDVSYGGARSSADPINH